MKWNYYATTEAAPSVVPPHGTKIPTRVIFTRRRVAKIAKRVVSTGSLPTITGSLPAIMGSLSAIMGSLTVMLSISKRHPLGAASVVAQ